MVTTLALALLLVSPPPTAERPAPQPPLSAEAEERILAKLRREILDRSDEAVDRRFAKLASELSDDPEVQAELNKKGAVGGFGLAAVLAAFVTVVVKRVLEAMLFALLVSLVWKYLAGYWLHAAVIAVVVTLWCAFWGWVGGKARRA